MSVQHEPPGINSVDTPLCCPICGTADVTVRKAGGLALQTSEQPSVLAYRCVNGHTYIAGSRQPRSEKEHLLERVKTIMRNTLMAVRQSETLLDSSRQLLDMAKQRKKS